jgi:hypothetical protein
MTHPPLTSVGILSPGGGEKCHLPRTQAERLHPQGEGTPAPEVRAGRRQHHLPTSLPDGGRPMILTRPTRLIYEVHGGEDGPVRNFMAMRGNPHQRVENDQFISTARVDQRLIVKAVAVEELAGAMACLARVSPTEPTLNRWPLPSEIKHGRSLTGSNASMAPWTSAFVVIACCLLLPGAGRWPPVRRLGSAGWPALRWSGPTRTGTCGPCTGRSGTRQPDSLPSALNVGDDVPSGRWEGEP